MPEKNVIDVGETLRRAAQAAAARGFLVESFGETGGFPLLGLTRAAAGARRHIYVSAGIHGDEPAPPLAVLGLLEEDFFRADTGWALCPILNPRGLALGTRENPEGVDLNRDYRGPRSAETAAHVAWLRRQPAFDVTLALHEDWESRGFYLYEQNPQGKPSLAGAILGAAGAHCPIDLDPVIEGREAREGVIRPVGDPHEREQWPESIYLRVHHTSLAYTLESPSSLPLERRVLALKAAVKAAVRALD